MVSASLDQTVRVWDISGLRKKTVSPGGDDIMRLPQVMLKPLDPALYFTLSPVGGLSSGEGIDRIAGPIWLLLRGRLATGLNRSDSEVRQGSRKGQHRMAGAHAGLPIQ